MDYQEAQEILKKQEAAKAVLQGYQKLADAHEQFGFKTRRAFIEALREIDTAGRGKAGRKGRGKTRGKKRTGGRGLSPADVDRIQSLSAEGKSNAEISRTTGVSPITVAKYVKGAAGKAAPAKRKTKKTAKAKKGGRALSPAVVEQIQKLKTEGKSNAEISRTVGASPLTVAKYVKGKGGPRVSAKRKGPAKGKKRAKKQ